MTETVAAKATRLVASGSISWTHAGAIVQGDTHDYLVQRHQTCWTCSCPSTLAHCSHIIAAALVAPEGQVQPAIQPAQQDEVDPFVRF